MNLTPDKPDRRRHRPEAAFQEWETPRQLYDRIAALFGGFDVDAAASPHNAKCPRFWTAADNGLVQDPTGLKIFCNPSFAGVGRWAYRAFEVTRAGQGCPLWVLCCPPKSDARWWRDYPPEWIIWITGRVRFERGGVAEAQNAAATCLLVYSSLLAWGIEDQIWIPLCNDSLLPRCIPARERDRNPTSALCLDKR